MYTISQNTLPRELLDLTRTLAEEYPICFDGTGKSLFFEKTESADCCFSCRIDGNSIKIRYSCISAAARGIASALAGIECTCTGSCRKI